MGCMGQRITVQGQFHTKKDPAQKNKTKKVWSVVHVVQHLPSKHKAEFKKKKEKKRNASDFRVFCIDFT
jgi:hypothetical protein